MNICVDSNIIIWGIKKQSTPGQEDMIARAEQIFSRADQYEDIILIPTLVMAEILTPEPPSIRANYIEIFNKYFIIVPFDTRAAMKYAEILFERVDEAKKIADSISVPRRKMKIDHMIIATALVNNANCIYSTDEGLKTFAAGLIDVRDIPPKKQITPNNSKQTLLFEPNKGNNNNNDENKKETS